MEGASGNLRKEESDSSVQDPETEGGSAQCWATGSGELFSLFSRSYWAKWGLFSLFSRSCWATCSGGLFSLCSRSYWAIMGGYSVCSLGLTGPQWEAIQSVL